MGTEKIKRTLSVFVKRVNKKYSPHKIILFGSYARGEAKESSDVDVLIVADNYEKKKWFDRSVEFHKLTSDLEPDINVIAITPDEEKKSTKFPTIQNALTSGILLSTGK